MNKLLTSILFVLCSIIALSAQVDRWQQHAVYDMDIDFDVDTHQFQGKQEIAYTNNSPDDLKRVFYHLYFNAFQPGSMMDVRSQSLPDADPRVASRISTLSEGEIGYHKILSLKQDGKDVKYEVVGTILEVELAKTIKPGETTKLKMAFESQVPVQIRRSGRDNKEGISYSMTQWYPKLCEYDYQGWHANPYIGREFHGIWGDFNVAITIRADYTIGGTGYLQNAKQIGHGYNGDKTKNTSKDKTLTWKFEAPNVHDFAWAADADYTHNTFKRADGVEMHFIFQESEKTTDNWEKLPEAMDAAFEFINKKYGKYPYDQYTFIQGGDGGMEYPMATLITGERSYESLVGVSVHELMHSWYQMMMGTNEALYAWMDEGFTSFGSNETMAYLRANGYLGPKKKTENPQKRSYSGYTNLVLSGVEEPMTTHADHFNTNFAYGQAAYSKGSVYLNQLSYIIGQEDFDAGMLAYYDNWKFKHPNPNDFIRIMEKQSGLELDWYNEYWVQTTKVIDYGIDGMEAADKKETKLTLAKNGTMPMPIDIVVTDNKNKKHYFNIPLRIMRGSKAADRGMNFEVLPDWPWTNPTYEVTLPFKIKKIKSIEIDPTARIADIDFKNNKVSVIKGEMKKEEGED